MKIKKPSSKQIKGLAKWTIALGLIAGIIFAILYGKIATFTNIQEIELTVISIGEESVPDTSRQILGQKITISVTDSAKKFVVFSDGENEYRIYGDDVYYTYRNKVGNAVIATKYQYFYSDKHSETKIKFKRIAEPE